MVRFIDQEGGKVLIEVCVHDKAFTCGIIHADGGAQFFKRYFVERERKFFPSELRKIAEKGEELARAFRERPDGLDEQDDILWEDIFGDR